MRLLTLETQILLSMRFCYKSLFNLIFPPTCLACRAVLAYQEEHLCLVCLGTLPAAELGTPIKKATLMRKFFGRIPFRDGYSLYHFSKKGRVQQLLHSVKYYYQPAALLFLGKVLGNTLRREEDYAHIDLVIPVPLHPKRYKVRGYNQSALLGQGISEKLEVPMAQDGLVREVHTLSQTTKTRVERWENVSRAFAVRSAFAPTVKGKHVLLVDDLVTTGATLTACAQRLMDSAVAGVSFATLAIAS